MDFYLAVSPEEFEATKEIPGSATVTATNGSPGDQIMIRGRIDALLIPPAPASLTLIDYKTDRLAPEAVLARARFYAPQVQLYRRAIERITGRIVGQIDLVFLAAKQIIAH
jgi:ATP-dependent exoDNAse (exonuclease V) beta subunit